MTHDQGAGALQSSSLHILQQVLREDDRALVCCATNLALAQDTRNCYVVMRVQLTMGDGMPPRLVPCHASAPEKVSPGKRLVANARGKFIYKAGRLLACVCEDTCDASRNMAAYRVDVVRVVF